MRTCGASNFVFLGRSGSDSPQAADLVQSLERSGSRVIVVRGDVANPGDVANAVKAAQSLGRVGGVVHAAMGLHEDLFNRMSNEGWQTSVRPKWAGAWNLHNALHEEDLDFFLLTSSMTGTVRVATESNYCAANAFLDAFAYWRRAQGKRATSVGLGIISEVGYLHENLKIESLLLRRGIKPLNEDEFLQLVDLAITGAGKGPDSMTSAAWLMLTGMETCGVRDLLSRGYEVTHTVMDYQRSAILSAALEASQKDHRSANSDTNWDPSTAQWLKGIHQDAAVVLKAESNANCLKDAIEDVIGRKFSNLLLILPEKVDYKRFFVNFGADSMTASEFRTWFWNVFKVDVSFLDLLGSESNLSTVAAQVEALLHVVARIIHDLIENETN